MDVRRIFRSNILAINRFIRPGPLVVAARRAGSFLEVTVRNHGHLGTRPADRPGGLGISLARLQAIYGAQASLDIGNGGENVIAVLRVPAVPPARDPSL